MRLIHGDNPRDDVFVVVGRADGRVVLVGRGVVGRLQTARPSIPRRLQSVHCYFVELRRDVSTAHVVSKACIGILTSIEEHVLDSKEEPPVHSTQHDAIVHL